MSKHNLSKKPASIPEQPKSVAGEPANSVPFKGFLLAAYRSLAKNTRSLKITRTMLISYLLILVIVPPIIIMTAFFIAPSQTAGFFNFQTRTQQAFSQKLGSRVLGESTANTSQSGVLGEYVAAVLEPQAVAAVRTIRVISPQKVSDIVLPSEQAGAVSLGSNEAITGPQGPAGSTGAVGPQGLQGLAGAVGAAGSVGTLSTGDGLSGNITGGGDLTLDIALATSGTTTTSSSTSGLETTPSGLSLIKGCGDSQVLVWNDITKVWECSMPATGVASLNGLSAITQTFANDTNLTITSLGSIHTLGWNGFLPVSRGGLGAGTLTVNGLLLGNDTGAVQSISAPAAGQLLLGDSSGVPSFTVLSGDAAIASDGVLTLKSVGTASTYGSATQVPVLTTDAQGRVSGVTDTAISGLAVSNFGSSNISQWTNDSSFISDGNINWDNSYGFITDGNTGWDNSYGFITSADDTVSGLELDGVFSLNGILVRTGAATYSIISNNSANWDAAYSHSNATANVHGLTFTMEGAGGGLDADTVDGLHASSFLATEADTLASVTGRGASTAVALTLNGGIITTTSTALTLDSGTTGDVNIGTGSNAKAITFGNTTGATAVNINSGTENINFGVGSNATSGKVQIGNSGTATPDLLVLDNGTADPTGVNGGMYYNTSTNKFRCYQNSAWANCITPSGSNLQYVTSYKANDTLINITSSTTTLTTVSITPSTATGDVLVRAGATFQTSNNTDQSLVIAVRQTNCTGTILQSTTFAIAANTKSVQPQHLDLNYVAVNPGALSQTYAFCASTATGDTDVTDWNMSAVVIDTGADLAEIYTTNDSNIEVGDVVSLDSSLQTGMKKSTTPYDQNALGIISTNPGMVIGSVDKEGVKALPVALSGRVPVKVSMQNGPINAGDYLTTSSTPGVAMKATRSGAIIGTAMTSFDGEGIGQVIVFVKNGSSIGSNLDNKDYGNDILAQLVSVANSHASDSADILNEAKDITSNPEKPAETGSAIETNAINYITRIVLNLFKNTVEFFGKVIFHSDITFQGRPTFNQDTAGHAFIKAGGKEVSVFFEKEYAQNPVVTASINLVDGVKMEEVPFYAIYNLSTKGFKIKLSKKTDFDLNFSWVALFVLDNNEPSHSDLNTPSASATPDSSPTDSETETEAEAEIRLQAAIPETAPSPTTPDSSPAASETGAQPKTVIPETAPSLIPPDEKPASSPASISLKRGEIQGDSAPSSVQTVP